MIATPQMSLEAAALLAEKVGVKPYILGDSIEGEARHVGMAIAGIARQIANRNQPFEAPCVLLSSGETTVTVRGGGRGGRNSEFLLALGIALEGHPHVSAIAGDTDGIDGVEEIAGAIWLPDTLARAVQKGFRPQDSLDGNDAHAFFESLGDGIITGPTMKNVNDFRAILIHDNLSPKT
jgi:hydroxypyruvate reductase